MNCLNCLWDTKDKICKAGFFRREGIRGVDGFCSGWKEDLSSEEIMTIDNKIIEIQLKEEYPYGHPDFIPMVLDEIRLHSNKNHDFAKGGNPLGNFERVAKILSQYPGLKPDDPVVIAIAFMLKQLDASLWMLSQGTVAKVEGHKERWRDISVYAKIISILIEEKR